MPRVSHDPARRAARPAVHVLTSAACALLVHAVPAFAADAAAPDDERNASSCDAAMLKGNFAFAVRGHTHADTPTPLPAPLIGPFAATGTTRYDGVDQVTIEPRSASFNGVVRENPAETGRYHVGADCVVVAKYPSGVTTRGVIVDGGRAIDVMQTNAGTTIGGRSERRRYGVFDTGGMQRPLRCSADGMAGSYGFLAEGLAGPPTLPVAPNTPLVGVGRVTLKPDGTFDAVALRSVGGMLDPEPLPLPGRFSVDEQCAVEMTFDVGFTFKGSVTGSGRSVQFVETNAGTTLLVRAERLD